MFVTYIDSSLPEGKEPDMFVFKKTFIIVLLMLNIN